jgi:hypothetical protein
MNNNEVITHKRNSEECTVTTVVYFITLMVEVAMLFALDLSATLQLVLVVCIIATFGSMIHNELNIRLKALEKISKDALTKR